MQNSNFDVIIVGSGTCGATIARELIRNNKRVLLLEHGSNTRLKETFIGICTIARDFLVGDKLKSTVAMTVGGSTSLYFGVCKLPTKETYKMLGLDLSDELAELRNELPIRELPDEFFPPQSILVETSAKELGYQMKRNLMLIDQSKCTNGNYCYDAKWKAKSYISQAIGGGASMITKATVLKVITENGQAIGVEYKRKNKVFGWKICKAYGKKIVISAGSLVTPKLLIDCGVKNIGNQGFFCKPAYMVCGTVSDLKGKDAFLGAQDIDLGNGVYIGDGAMNSSMFKLFMLANLKLKYYFSHSKIISMGILIFDSMGGKINSDGQYYKKLTADELLKMEAAEEIAINILKNAGAKDLFRTKLVAGIPGGVLKIKEHLDENMQTKIKNLYVCDHSLMPDVKITPTITLICLAKRLASHLSSSIQTAEPVEVEA